MRRLTTITLLLAYLLLNSCRHQAPVLSGLDRLNEFHSLFKGKRVGLITNHTARDNRGRHAVDVFLSLPGTRLTTLFGPEHGIRGQADAGQKVVSSSDSSLHIPIYSLYGKTRKPTSEMLRQVDVLVFDIQDIGARFYTYIWTMALSMEAAAEQHKTFVVLDRPNPLNGVTVEGPLLKKKFSSFVGLFPIPVRHGMTVGELAKLFNEEGWLGNGLKADLKIIPMKNWKRSMWFDQTGLKFIKPSPNMPDLATATVYPGMCLLEGTNVSEGRGTQHPFVQFGAPWIDERELTAALNKLQLPGLRFTENIFTPQSIKSMSLHPKYKGRLCRGCKLQITDLNRLQAFRSGVKVVETIFKLYPDSLQWRERHFDRLCGTDAVRRAIISGRNVDSLNTVWAAQAKNFKKMRKKYLLY